MTQKDGSFLISKKDEKANFKWSDMSGKHVIAGRPAGVPAMTLEYVMKNAGVDTSTELFDTSVDFNMIIGAFEGGSQYDYCTMFEPSASEFESLGKGYVVASIGEASDNTPYTVFSAKQSYIKENTENVENFLKAIAKGYNYVKNTNSLEVAKKISKQFPGISETLLASSIDRYLEIEAFSPTGIVKEEDFNRLQDIIEQAGHLQKRADFKKVVDNTYVNKLNNITI